MAKNLVSGQILAPFFSCNLLLLDVRHYKLSMYAISRKTNELNLTKWQKKPSFGPQFFFSFKNLAPSVTRYHQKKAMIQSRENVDGQE